MNKKVRILSLDGGGMRGIIPATVLKYVEEKLQEKSKNKNARLADFFDLIVGTSTGGILTCFYLISNPSKEKDVPTSKYPASKALEFYVEKGGLIFDDSKNKSWFGLRQLFNATRFNPNNIENIFEEEFGDKKLSELLQPCIITSYDMESQSAVFFHSRETKPDRDFRIKDVVRSTSAAPTYFPPANIINLASGRKMINLDGGVFANNPAMCAYVEARKTDFGKVKNPGAKDMIFLSVGTGGGKLHFPKVEKSGMWSVVNWAKSIPDIMMDGGAETVHYQMEAIFGTLGKKEKVHYKRIDVPFDKRNYSSDMSDASEDNIKALGIAGKDTLKDAQEKKEGELNLDEFIELLV
ncbi:MAG: patatin-like phospholipase family protein [Bacteroidetes bacterium]|nr:patatin-like phospholipase family protein [Bacteroidota bacterium]